MEEFEEDHTNLSGMDPFVSSKGNGNILAGFSSSSSMIDELDVPREIVLQRILELVHQKVVRPLFVPTGRSNNDDDDSLENDDDHSSSSPTNNNNGDPDMIEIDKKSFFHLSHCRSLTSILLVASYCQKLLLTNRTTSTREVYYYYVTHFFHQKESDKAIWDLARILNVSRSSLGLYASPKGWFCGCIDLYNENGDLVLNGRELDNVHGMPITSTIHKQYINSTSSRQNDNNNRMVSQDAQFILVIEKEGVYTRLAEDKFFLHCLPCILVTGKGFPDMATRQWVRQMAHTLQLPVYGLADCNPYGVAVLHSYQYQQSSVQRQAAANNNHNISAFKQEEEEEEEEDRPFAIQWLGLRPSQLALDPQLKSPSLPPNVFQALTDRDSKLLQNFLAHEIMYHPFVRDGLDPEQRWHELKRLEHKVELEALNWKGMDFLCQWVHQLILDGSNINFVQRSGGGGEQSQQEQEHSIRMMLNAHRRHQSQSSQQPSNNDDDDDDSKSTDSLDNVQMKWNQII